MKDYVIVSDTTCDLSQAVLDDFNIEMINAHFMDRNGEDRLSFTDWKSCDYYNSSADFYKALKASPDKFSTAAPSIDEVKENFVRFLNEGKDILAFTISSAMSGTFNIYTEAKREVLKDYPEAKIMIIDSLRFGGGIGLMEIHASILRKQGKTIEEVYEYINNNKNCFHQMGWLDDLSFVAKKGRITHAKAFFGQLIGIKPLGECDQNGLTTVVGKAKGEKAAYSAMISYIKETITNPSEQIILICHSQREKQALIYKKLIGKEFNPKRVYLMECGPSCGINIGPGLNSAYYFGKVASKDLVNEKELMEKLLLK